MHQWVVAMGSCLSSPLHFTYTILVRVLSVSGLGLGCYAFAARRVDAALPNTPLLAQLNLAVPVKAHHSIVLLRMS